MERLWNHLTSFQTWRDQPGLAYLMWKTAILPAVLPDRLGTSRDNEFAYKFAHKKPTAKPVPATARRAPKRLIWIYREKFSAVASTLLRGHQLAELATQRLEGKVEIGVVNETHLGEQRDSILVLTKGFLKHATLGEITRLKLRGNIICADYVDDPERVDLREAIDVYIAASIRQYIHYSDAYPEKVVHLVSHHADLGSAVSRARTATATSAISPRS
jgi:hypothetical protein